MAAAVTLAGGRKRVERRRAVVRLWARRWRRCCGWREGGGSVFPCRCGGVRGGRQSDGVGQDLAGGWWDEKNRPPPPPLRCAHVRPVHRARTHPQSNATDPRRYGANWWQGGAWNKASVREWIRVAAASRTEPAGEWETERARVARRRFTFGGMGGLRGPGPGPPWRSPPPAARSDDGGRPMGGGRGGVRNRLLCGPVRLVAPRHVVRHLSVGSLRGCPSSVSCRLCARYRGPLAVASSFAVTSRFFFLIDHRFEFF